MDNYSNFVKNGCEMQFKMYMEMYLPIDDDLRDMMISALRYALGRKTYMVETTANFIKKHFELMDDRTCMIMLNDLRHYFDRRIVTEDNDDYECVWDDLYVWLQKCRTILKGCL